VVLHKSRISGTGVSLRSVIGEVRDRAPIIVDDMIATGRTIETAVKGLLDAGCAPDVSVVATHPVFAGGAVARLQALPIQRLIATNSVESAGLPAHFQVVNVAPMIAETIARLNRDRSLETLLAHRK
jgi:ribose-phosphate pyrophosphokinase